MVSKNVFEKGLFAHDFGTIEKCLWVAKFATGRHGRHCTCCTVDINTVIMSMVAHHQDISVTTKTLDPRLAFVLIALHVWA